MKNLLPAVSICMIAISFGACDLEETPVINLPPFNYIQSNGGVTFKLVTGADTRLLSSSVMESMYRVSGGVLVVNASGGSMTIAVKNLILNCNACSVENPEPMIADTLSLSIHAGSADLYDVQVNGYLGLNAQNTGTYKFNGYAHFFNARAINLVSIKAQDLLTDSVYVNSSSILDTEVRATQVVNVFINSMGSVIYHGNPPIVRLTNTGTGRLIKEE